ncbi:hypothetical protein GQ42DRAFT_160367 [Ramicandelaber brevisporus]|nr:hypothetical protein GQ42DRAFT_160367 [Ramicandelaber brevisporus]
MSVEISTANEPLLLSDLPLELLGEIATMFSQAEAASLLTVSKHFHEEFSRTVWRHLVISGKHLRTLPSAWRRYGHLVRILEVAFGQMEKHVPGRMRRTSDRMKDTGPVIASFFNSCGGGGGDGGGELAGLRKLRVVFCDHFSWDIKDAGTVTDWVHGAESRNQNIKVDWDVYCSDAKQCVIVDKLVQCVDNIGNHTLSVMVQTDEVVSPMYLPKFAEIITELNLSYYDSFIFFAQCKRLFGNRNIIYPRLERLYLSSSLFQGGHDEDALVNFGPAQFPSLRHLELSFEDHADAGLYAPIHSHTWPTVIELTLLHCETERMLAATLRSFPNVNRLKVIGGYSTELQSISRHLQQLETLTIQGIYDPAYIISDEEGVHCQLSNIRELVITADGQGEPIGIKADTIRFILHGAPKLETLNLYHCWYSNKYLDQFDGQVNGSVHTVIIGPRTPSYLDKKIAKLIALFPNLQLLKMLENNEDGRRRWQELFPSIKVELVKYIRE